MLFQTKFANAGKARGHKSVARLKGIQPFDSEMAHRSLPFLRINATDVLAVARLWEPC